MAAPVTITIDAENRSEDEIRQIIEGLKLIGESGERANKEVERAAREAARAARDANRERIREERYILRLQERNRRQEERALRDALAFRRALIKQQTREEEQAAKERARNEEQARKDESRALSDAIAFRRAQIKQQQREEEQAARERERIEEETRRNQERALRDAVAFRRAQVRRQQQEEREQLRRTQQVIRGINNAYRSLTRRLLRFGTLGGLAGGFGLVQGIRSTIEAATELDTIRRTLTALTGSVVEANRQLQLFRDLARLPGISFIGAANAAIQFRNVGVELSRSIALMRELGNVAAFSGQRLEDVSFNVAQLIAQGRFNQRDLREAINRMQLLGQALGSTVAEELNAQLQRSGQDITTFLTERLQRLPRADVDSASNIFNNFSIAIRELQAEIGQLALPELTRHVRDLTEYIRNNTDQILTRFERGIRRVEGVVNGLLGSFRDLIGFLRAGIIAASLGRIATSFLGFTVNAANAGSALNGFLSALVDRGGRLASFAALLPRLSAGIAAVSGVGAAVAASFALFDFVRFIRGMKEGAEATSGLDRALNSISAAAKTAAEDIDDVSESVEALTASQILVQLANVESSFNTIRNSLEQYGSINVPSFDEIVGADNAQLIENLRRRDLLLQEEIFRQRELVNLHPRSARVNRTRLTTLEEEQRLLSQLITLLGDYTTLQQNFISGLNATPQRQPTQQNRQQQEQRAFQREITTGLQRNFVLLSRSGVLEAQQAFRRRQINLANNRLERTHQRNITQSVQERYVNESRAQLQVISIRDRNNQIERQYQREIMTDVQQRYLGEQQLLDATRRQRDRDNQTELNHQREITTAIQHRFVNENNAREAAARTQRRIDRAAAQRQRDELSRRVRTAFRDPVGEGIDEESFRRQFDIVNNLRSQNQSITENSERQHAETLIAIQQGVARQGLNSALELAFNRQATFQQIAGEFLRQSVRIIAQNLLETQFILANNQRLIESNNRVAESRIRALGGGGDVGLTPSNEAVISAAANLVTGNIGGAIASFAPQIVSFLKVGENQAVEITDLAEEAIRNRR